jgi:uncharacterized membrane protein
MAKFSQNSLPRLPFLDIWRAFAVILMVIYHALYIFDYQGVINIDMSGDFYYVFRRLVQWSFFLLVGIGLTLSYYRRRANLKQYRVRHFKRAVKVMALALLVTVASAFFNHDYLIFFGVLHLISVAILFWSLLAPRKWVTLIIATLILLIGWKLKFDWQGYQVIGTPLDEFVYRGEGYIVQLIFGFSRQVVSTFDYFPLFPWLGVSGLGVFFGHFIYKYFVLGGFGGCARGEVAARSGGGGEVVDGGAARRAGEGFCFKILQTIGQKALLIYMLHVPVVVVIGLLLR